MQITRGSVCAWSVIQLILLSILKAVEAGKVVEFDEVSCRILDANRKLITAAMRVANLYYLNCVTDCQ